jgi:DNA-binding NarL/FixJ family response regulator
VADFEEAGRQADGTGSMWTAAFAHTCRASVLFHQGQLAAAADEAAAGLATAEEQESWTHVPELLALLAEVAVRRGELGPARALVGRGQHVRGQLLGSGFERLVWAAARIDEADGDPHGALLRLLPVYADLATGVAALVHDASAGPDLVRLAMSQDDLDRAEITAAAAERLAAANPEVVSITVAATQARGLVAADPELLAAAADASEASPRPYARARACEDAAAAYLAGGRHGLAVDYLDRALAEHDSSGATVAAQRVRARLAALGARTQPRIPPKRPAFGWDSLTEAELRVARAAASGLTNRAIADQLYVSTHTVESHLRHSFAKLGVRSRVELTRQVIAYDGEQHPM